MKKNTTITINTILLGDDVGHLADALMARDFKPEAIVILGLSGNTIRMRHSCRNNAELLGMLAAAMDDLRIGYDQK